MKNPSYQSTYLYQLHKLTTALDLIAERELSEELGVSFSQFRILMALEENPLSNQREVTQYVGISPGAVSYQLEAMRERGLIEQTANERSRRENVLKLTPRGKRLAEEAFKLLDERFKDIFAVLEPPEQKELGQALTRLLKVITRQGRGETVR